MDDILTNINLAGKLRGSFVADNAGHIVAQQVLAPGDREIPSMLAAPIVGLLGMLEAQGANVSTIDLEFSHGKTFIRNFAWGAMIMLGSDTSNLPLLNILIESAMPKIKRMMDTDEFRGKRKKTQ